MHQAPSSAATLIPFLPSRVHASLAASPARAVSRPVAGRDREGVLLDAWREAHWSLRLSLAEVTRRLPRPDLERLYERARRADNELNAFYKARADVLATQLRDLRDTRGATATADAHAGPEARGVPDGEAAAPTGLAERALLARYRAMSPDDRAALLRLAVHLTRPDSGRCGR